MRDAFKAARNWEIQPGEFWAMSPTEWWAELDARLKQQRESGGQHLPGGGFDRKAWEDARRRHKAKR